MKLDKITPKIILNSRGEKTFEVEVESMGLKALASTPAGKSKGRYEAKTIPVDLALKRFTKIEPQILTRDYSDQKDFDNFLIELSFKDKSFLGVNLVLALSIAFVRLLAKLNKKPLFEYLREIYGKNSTPKKSPYLFLNLINGGLHAPSGPNIQEYLIVPQFETAKESLLTGINFFNKLKKYFYENYGEVKYGDEGGIVIPFKDPEFPLKMYSDVGFEKENLRLALDCAASSFYKDGYYSLDSEKYNSDQVIGLYSKYISKYNLLSFEDPFAESDISGFKKFYQKFGQKVLIIGDDLTVTNPELIKKAAEQKLINTVLIKPNQIGTVSETLEAIRTCEKLNLKTVVSHRSGETMDSFIADLAYAVEAFGLKSGAPEPEERMSKYYRLVEIEKYKN